MRRLISWSLLLSALLLIPASPVYAKKATIKWKLFKLAKQYHLQVLKNGDVLVDEKMGRKATKWSGDLKPGLYQYRIRVYDKVNRAGKWSKSFPLVVKPDPPKPMIENNAPLYPDSDGGIVLEWEPIPEVNEYRVFIKRYNKTVFRKTYRGTRARIGKLKPGNYSWQVQGVLKSGRGKRVPASLKGKVAAGDLSPNRNFVVKDYLFVPTATVGLFAASGPYSYEIDSGTTGNVDAIGMNNGLAGEVWFSNRWLANAQITSHFQKIEGEVINLGDFSMSAGYAIKRATGSSPWEIRAGLGPRVRQYLRLNISGQTYQGFTKFFLGGVDASIMTRWFMSKSMIMGLELKHFAAFALFDAPSISGISNAGFGNVAAELSGRFKLSDRWDIQVGILAERIGVTIESSGSTGDMNQFQLSGFGALAFKFP